MKQSEIKIGTPVNVLWDKILLLPIFGVVDSARSQEIMETMLNKIIDTSSKVIILDILGVAVVDSAVASYLIRITKATRLVGAEAIISGISSEVAQTLVSLGIDLVGITTTATLADAVQLAFDKTGCVVKQTK